MMRIVNAGFVAAILVYASFVYGLERESRQADSKLAELRNKISDERENIRRLNAEWSHLNTPARLETLANKHLHHAPGQVSQVVQMNEIAEKVPGLKPGASSKPLDPIADMLAGNIAATEGEVAAGASEPDLIAKILKGME